MRLPRSTAPNKFALYEASVQDPYWDLKNMAAMYRAANGSEPRILREDFCATAAISYAWARRHRDNRAIGVDLDPAPLAWAQRHRGTHERVTLVRGDVRKARAPHVDLACALNFSWWIFKERHDLLAYLRAARASLRPQGILILNAYGGTSAERVLTERTRKPAGIGVDGKPHPRFTYIWEHAQVNAVDRNLVAHIHFELDGGRTIKKAFTYDWRMWTLPDARDVAREAGFSDVTVWEEDDGKLSRPKHIDNGGTWMTNLVCHR